LEPQNNMRIFVDGKVIYSGDFGPVAQSDLETEVAASGLPINGCEGMLEMLSIVLTSPELRLVNRLKRVQAWAAGPDAASLADELYQWLKEESSDANGMLSHTLSFQGALDGLAGDPCNESGISVATRRLEATLASARARERRLQGQTVQPEVVKCLVRYLLGRTAQDLSILVNFTAWVPPKEELQLAAWRFRPLADFYGRKPGFLLPTIPDLVHEGDATSVPHIWARVSVVDTDAKCHTKIPEYKQQFETLKQAWAQHQEHEQEGNGSACNGQPLPALHA